MSPSWLSPFSLSFLSRTPISGVLTQKRLRAISFLPAELSTLSPFFSEGVLGGVHVLDGVVCFFCCMFLERSLYVF
jgi:hypothetical protein